MADTKMFLADDDIDDTPLYEIRYLPGDAVIVNIVTLQIVERGTYERIRELYEVLYRHSALPPF